MECRNSRVPVELLSLLKGKDVLLGVIDVASDVVETPEDVVATIISAMKHVPAAMKDCLDKSGVSITDLKKVFIHQANEKMDDGIIKRMYQLYGIDDLPENIMPMSIHWLGNSSVATVPTLYDLVRKDEMASHQLAPGDIILFASVGAGMNVNAVCYRC